MIKKNIFLLGMFFVLLVPLFSENETSSSILQNADPKQLRITLSNTAMSTEPSAPVSSLQVRFSDYLENGLAAWTIQIVNAQGKPYRTWQGNRNNLDQFPQYLQFNGLTDQKEPIPDGTYQFLIRMEYTNGDILVKRSPFFAVQSQKPFGLVRASRPTLSVANPEGVLLYHDLSSDTEWTGLITDTNQNIIKKIPLGRNTEAVVRWQGETDSGNLVNEGTYYYFAEGVNSVGLRGRTLPVPIRVEPPQKGTIWLQLDHTIFSGRSREGKLILTPRSKDIGNSISYQFSIKNLQNGGIVRQESGTLPSPFVWDGRDTLGLLCPDGTYQAELKVQLTNGKTLTALSQSFRLDSTPPEAHLTVKDGLFSPNGDGLRDSVTIIINAEGGTEWTGSIVNAEGIPIKSFFWKNNPPNNLIWDGRDDGNNLAPNGTYHFKLEGIDLAGNRTVVTSDLISLDARKPQAILTSDLQAFSPNKDGFADVVKIRLVSAFTDGLSHFVLEIRDQNGKPIRHLAEGSSLDQNAQFEWDGSDDAPSATVSDGDYTPWAQLEYAKGDIISISGKPIRLDRTPPIISISMKPESFSPNLSITISAEDASEINGWKLSILDPAGNLFTSFSGKAVPREPIVWDGYNLDNQLIEATKEYSYILQVRDVLGNMATKKGTLKPKPQKR
jgi:flagellar hook assembly protein FlgD